MAVQIFEVFRQKRQGEEFVHVGEVEAPDVEAAMLGAKEHFARRELCSGLWVTARSNIKAAHWGPEVLGSGHGKNYRKSEGLKVGRSDILS